MFFDGGAATALYSKEGFVVNSGSSISKEIKSSISQKNAQVREQLIDSGTIQEMNGRLEFIENYLFSSPSQAAAVVSGRAANGRTAWKNNYGVTLKEIEEGV